MQSFFVGYADGLAPISTRPTANIVMLRFLMITYRWLSARRQYLQHISNGDTTVLQKAIDIFTNSDQSNYR